MVQETVQNLGGSVGRWSGRQIGRCEARTGKLGARRLDDFVLPQVLDDLGADRVVCACRPLRLTSPPEREGHQAGDVWLPLEAPIPRVALLRVDDPVLFLKHAKATDSSVLGVISLNRLPRAVLLDRLYPVASAAWDNRKPDHTPSMARLARRSTPNC